MTRASAKIEHSRTILAQWILIGKIRAIFFHRAAKGNGEKRLHPMRIEKFKIGLTIVAAIFTCSAAFAASDCREPEAGTDKVPMFSPPLAEVVTGSGRLQFYSAPNPECMMSGVFVIPKDELTAYAETDDGWTSVMYTNPRTNDVVNGWVKSARLKATGTVGPKQ
jgi:hypothetical protein